MLQHKKAADIVSDNEKLNRNFPKNVGKYKEESIEIEEEFKLNTSNFR